MFEYNLGTTIGLLLFVACTQFLAASAWERKLWRRPPHGWVPYFKIGFYWGTCGVGLFSIAALGFADPGLLRWMLDTGLLLVFIAVAWTTASLTAWFTVKRPLHTATRAANVVIVAVFMTFDYPVLKWLQTGQWLLRPEHLLIFSLYLLSFASVLTLSTVTLGYVDPSDSERKRFIWRFFEHPRVRYTTACLLLDLLWMMLQVELVHMYPVALRGADAQLSESGLFNSTNHTVELFAIAAGLIGLSLLVNAYSRRQTLWVQDRLAWNSAQTFLPAEQQVFMENTRLVKKTLSMAQVAVVTWHAPESARGIGSDNLRSGTTFISPGILHDAGLSVIAPDINLPDFWAAIIHPDDQTAALDGIQAMLKGERDIFHGVCRFKAPEGDWFTIRGELQIERSPVNGLPLSICGIHANITDEMEANATLGATRVRQLNALRMIGHDLRSSMSTVLMASTLLQRLTQDGADERIHKNVDRIRTAAHKALDFLGDAVTYARTEDRAAVGEPTDVNIGRLVHDIVVQETARFGLRAERVSVVCPDAAVLVRVLEFPLTAALSNLISNAIKYTPDLKAQVCVSVRSLGAKTAGIEGCTLIEVADEGVGIPVGFAERLYGAFSRADNVKHIEGYGLGMAIVANALDLLDAELTVVSLPERTKGSAFALILPNALKIQAEETAGASGSEGVGGRAV